MIRRLPANTKLRALKIHNPFNLNKHAVYYAPFPCHPALSYAFEQMLFRTVHTPTVFIRRPIKSVVLPQNQLSYTECNLDKMIKNNVVLARGIALSAKTVCLDEGTLLCSIIDGSTHAYRDFAVTIIDALHETFNVQPRIDMDIMSKTLVNHALYFACESMDICMNDNKVGEFDCVRDSARNMYLSSAYIALDSELDKFKLWHTPHPKRTIANPLCNVSNGADNGNIRFPPNFIDAFYKKYKGETKKHKQTVKVIDEKYMLKFPYVKHLFEDKTYPNYVYDKKLDCTWKSEHQFDDDRIGFVEICIRMCNNRIVDYQVGTDGTDKSIKYKIMSILHNNKITHPSQLNVEQMVLHAIPFA